MIGKRDGETIRARSAHTAQSNAEFDASLRARNTAWGVRDLEPVAALAGVGGFGGPEIVEMPANNPSLIFRLEGRGDV